MLNGYKLELVGPCPGKFKSDKFIGLAQRHVGSYPGFGGSGSGCLGPPQEERERSISCFFGKKGLGNSDSIILRPLNQSIWYRRFRMESVYSAQSAGQGQLFLFSRHKGCIPTRPHSPDTPEVVAVWSQGPGGRAPLSVCCTAFWSNFRIKNIHKNYGGGYHCPASSGDRDCSWG